MILVACVSSMSLLIIGLVVRDIWRLGTVVRLGAGMPPADPPLVSLLIPARNEAASIGRCLDGALAQTYPRYEVIVVDDSSTDATPAILHHYAERDSRLKVITGTPLPTGWVGKCHACQQAAAAASGEWLLFLDADTAPQPRLVVSLIDHAVEAKIDMLTIFPFLELESFWERVIMPPFVALIIAVFPIERQNAPDVRPDELVANGQCILVRTDAYRAIGGHGAVRADVLEDVRLAQSLRANGARVGSADGAHLLRVRMYTNGSQVFAGLTKNAVAGFRNGGLRALWGGVRQFLIAFTPLWLLLMGVWFIATNDGPLGWVVLIHGLVVAAVTFSFWMLLLHRLYRLPLYYGLLWPLGMFGYCIIAVWAGWRVLSGRGVVWKGRAYAG